MLDEEIRSKLWELINDGDGHYLAAIEHAGCSVGHMLQFRQGRRKLGPRKREAILRTLQLIESGTFGFEKVPTATRPKTVLVKNEVASKPQLGYLSELSKEMQQSHDHQDVPLLSLCIGGRLHLRTRRGR